MVTWVKDLLLPNGTGWNFNLLNQLFDQHERHAITRIHISTTQEKDRLIWTPIATGLFSAKSMYQQLFSQQPSTSSNAAQAAMFNWNKFWKVRGVAPRILLFVWRALHGGLAVGDVLGRILNAENSCRVCSGVVETVEHALLLCGRARVVWNMSGLNISSNFNSLSVTEFFSTLLNDTNTDSFRLGCALAWVIWKARNSTVFNNSTVHVDEILKQGNQLFQDYNTAATSISDHLPDHTHSDLISEPLSSPHWLPPPIGFIKINVDGACMHGRTAAAAVARDHLGGYIGSASKSMGFGLPYEAEIEAFMLGMELLNRLNLSHVIIEGDAKVIVDFINNNSITSNWRIHHQVQACRDFHLHRNDVSFVFSPRSTNGAAHSLASFAITHEVTDFWSGGTPPPPLMDPLLSDLAFVVTNSSIND